jgi:hypothetical protein
LSARARLSGRRAVVRVRLVPAIDTRAPGGWCASLPRPLGSGEGAHAQRPDRGRVRLSKSECPPTPGPAPPVGLPPPPPTNCQGYNPCLPPGPDVDCAGGPGTGRGSSTDRCLSPAAIRTDWTATAMESAASSQQLRANNLERRRPRRQEEEGVTDCGAALPTSSTSPSGRRSSSTPA